MNAAMRMKNLPKTDNDTMSTLSRTMKDKVKEEWKDRVVHQRIRNLGIKDDGHCETLIYGKSSSIPATEVRELSGK
jgi:hypothetical protein